MAFWHNERVRWALTAAVVGLLVLFVLQLSRRPSAANDATLLISSAAEASAQPQVAAGAAASAAPTIAVDVIGAVEQPGVYYLLPAARTVDAIAAAGGLAPDAARDQINLAAAVVDGSQIRVPRVGEAAPAAAAVAAAGDTLININLADVAALDALPGIGPATAQAIVDQRTNGGAFKRIEDLENVKGIGPSLFAQIKARITVGP